jgi:hypothetical protein
MKTILYTCFRCEYKTKEKYRMKDHLYKRIKPCPAKSLLKDIELTDEIKDYILINRVYHIPKQVTNTLKPELIENDKEYHFIYMIRPKENVIHNENVYKIGKTKSKTPDINISRLTSYGKGTELVFISQCNDCNVLEREVLEEFGKTFDKHIFGNEYFIGDKYDMLKLISKVTYKTYE